MTDSPRRVLPSVDTALQQLPAADLPRALVVDTIRRELARIREAESIGTREEIMQQLAGALEDLRTERLQRVINATGIPLHTNFGRAPLCRAALQAIESVATGYSNLEYDLSSGTRGRRGAYVERCLALLCEAGAATVVNNCAAALVLILRHLTATKREVIISRGELVQIGGGFRIPDILESSGAKLREVGTTNRTVLEDYARAITAETGLILTVHRSNFSMSGFVESVPTEALAQLCVSAGVPLVQDLGSGAVVNTAAIAGLEPEPTPADVLRRGVDLVCFSGDKLFAGPQAGVVAGRADLVEALKREPFFRALRCDKLILAALERTAEAHLAGSAWQQLPALEMLSRETTQLQVRANAIVSALRGAQIDVRTADVDAAVGGGTLPSSRLKSIAVSIRPSGLRIDQVAASLRRNRPAVIGYVADDRLLLDLRTVAPSDDVLLTEAIHRALTNL